MPDRKIAYLELPAVDVPALKSFYGSLFGWTFQDFGEDYAAVQGAGLDSGLNGDPASKPGAPLAIIECDDIEALASQLQDAGGAITMPIFAYPGGRRFHFRDPSGNELAVMQPDK